MLLSRKHFILCFLLLSILFQKSFPHSLGQICLSNTNSLCFNDPVDIPEYPFRSYSNWLLVQTNWIPWEILWKEQQFVIDIDYTEVESIEQPQIESVRTLQEDMIITRVIRKVLDMEKGTVVPFKIETENEDTEIIAPHQFYFEIVPVVELTELYTSPTSNIKPDLSRSETEYPPSVRYYVKLNNLLVTNQYNSFFPMEESRKLSHELSEYYRVDLYRRFYMTKKTVIKETALNVIPSLGSWITGNRHLAIYTDIGIGLGGSLCLIGNLTDSAQLQSDGLSVLIATYILNFALPFLNEKLYNAKLKQVLNIDQELHEIALKNENNHSIIADSFDFSLRF